MSISLGTETVTTSERTWQVSISVELAADPTIAVSREKVAVDGSGKLLIRDRNIPTVSRLYSAVESQGFDLGGGLTMTGAQLYAAIAAVADVWRQEDIAAAEQESPPA